MKRFKIVIILILTITIVALTTIITACSNNEKAIIGKWRRDIEIGVILAFDFKPDNEVDVFMFSIETDGSSKPEELVGSGKYIIIGNKIELDLSGNPETVYFTPIPDEKGTFEYKIKGDNLILSPDGKDDENVFIKVK